MTWRALGLAAVVFSTLALVAWVAWRPTPHDPAVVETSGRVEGDQAAVGAKVGGRIVRLAVREGERVASGRTIAELGSEQVRAQLAQAEHGVHAARQRLAAGGAHRPARPSPGSTRRGSGSRRRGPASRPPSAVPRRP